MEIVTADSAPGRKPWSRRKGESIQAHQALICYLDMGRTRSHRRLAAEIAASEGLLGDWSRKWQWVDRALAYDSHNADVVQAGKDQARMEEAAKWERRRLESLEQDFSLGEELRNRVREMLSHPLTKKRTSKDGTRVTVMPARWNAGNIAQLAKLASEMQQNAAKTAIPAEEQGQDDHALDADTEAAIWKVYREDDEAAA